MAEWQWYRGEFATWNEAKRESSGYDEAAILERVIVATRAVRDGHASFERDGVAFPELHLNHQLLAALFRVAASSRNRLRVVDFGGSLGSAYWQHRSALSSLARLDWRVVEQPHFVAAGRREFEDGKLSFWPSLEEACADRRADLLLASGVIQNLEDPWLMVDRIVASAIPHLLFDRLPLLPGDMQRLTVEHVPPEIGAASYPVWFLSEERFLARFRGSYELLESYPTLLPEGIFERWQVFGLTIQNRGFFFRALRTRHSTGSRLRSALFG